MECGIHIVTLVILTPLDYFFFLFAARLDEFKNLNPPLDLVKGAEMELTIRGDTLLYKNALGNVGTIRSEVFTTALCDVFYGDDAVSPTHKDAVLAGVPKL